MQEHKMHKLQREQQIILKEPIKHSQLQLELQLITHIELQQVLQLVKHNQLRLEQQMFKLTILLELERVEVLQFLFQQHHTQLFQQLFQLGHIQQWCHIQLQGYTPFNIEQGNNQSRFFLLQLFKEQVQFHTQ